MTVYSLTPVDARDRTSGPLVESCTVADLLTRAAEMSTELEQARAHAWEETRLKVVAQRRSSEARAVVRELAGQSVEMHRRVAAAIEKVRRSGTWTS